MIALLHRQKDDNVLFWESGDRWSGGKRQDVTSSLLTWSSYMFTENKGATVHGLSPLTIHTYSESLLNRCIVISSDAVSRECCLRTGISVFCFIVFSYYFLLFPLL